MSLGNSLPRPTTVAPGERRAARLAVASLLAGPGVLVSGCLTGRPAQERIRGSHGPPEGNGLAMTRLICGYVSLVLLVLALLSALAVPGFRRARKRSQAAVVRNEAGLIDAAIDRFAAEKDKKAGDAVRWEDLAPYFEAGSRLAGSRGYDPLGRPYAIGRILNESTQVKVHPETVREFQDVTADPAGFWGDHLPEDAGLTSPQRPAASAVPRGRSQTFSWNCGCCLSAA